MIHKPDFYIDGRWVQSEGGSEWHLINPATEEPCAAIILGSDLDCDRAVAAARHALSAWSQTSHVKRIDVVRQIVALFYARQRDIAEAISLEMGAPIDFSYSEQAGCLPPLVEAFLESHQKIDWAKPIGPAGSTTLWSREPVGIVGLITPWNWPIYQVVLKVIPALLAGCTCILKPSEQSPLSALIFTELCHEAGVPPGVLNVLNGTGDGIGTYLAAHPDVDMISFTGSTRAGKAVTIAAAETLKKVTLELGGKGANLIFADCDDQAVAAGVREVMRNSGQTCSAPTRMLVERRFYAEAVDLAVQAANLTIVGPPSAPGNHIGPVVNRRQWEHIQGCIRTGIEEGATLVAGGLGRPEHLERGYYIKPTVFADVRQGMTIEQQEIFGPVVSIIPFDTEEEAIALANRTQYGLQNFFRSRDQARCNRVAALLKSGTVEINGAPFAPDASFGGVKASGRGREGGLQGIEEFLDSKMISGWASQD